MVAEAVAAAFKAMPAPEVLPQVERSVVLEQRTDAPALRLTGVKIIREDFHIPGVGTLPLATELVFVAE